ncbi:hypothetical protein V5O48_003198 [Marasmius crinis-equi]|uniref:Armadillo repeat-containing protein 8 n=1 Tax=Marasmius crinis-equi TaxID=585013 RepID=A0ABR3FUI9_9AGAR
MAIETFNTVDRLKGYKNKVIGNLTAKTQLSKDSEFLQCLVKCLSDSSIEIRIEAAHIISSISLGSDDAVANLLRADALTALLDALKQSTAPTVPNQPHATNLKSALARALRSLVTSTADIVGPSLWGLRPDASAIRNEALAALEVFFAVDSLDIVLPLLSQPHIDTTVSVAQLLAQSLRVMQHRTTVTEWVTQEDRQKEIKSKRGWEKASAHGMNAPGRQGGWVARNLVVLLGNRAHKVQEAALLALAALAKDNPSVATALTENEVLGSVVETPARSRIPDVQLAACLCATHIIRACPQSSDSIANTIINVLNRFISPPSTLSTISPQHQQKACYILYHLVIDDPAYYRLAFSRGCLLKLAGLLASLTIVPPGGLHAPLDVNDYSNATKTSASSSEPVDTDEPPTLSALREAALIALTALALLGHDIRMALTEMDLGDIPFHPALADLSPPGTPDSNQPAKQPKQVLPLLRLTLLSPHTGIRYASAELMRALTRSVAVLRTSVMDSGLGILVLERVMSRQEDRRVIGSALKAVCNCVCEFSPLRTPYVKVGLIGRLVEFIRGVETHRPEGADETEISEGSPVLDTSLRPNALWAIKNLVRKSSTTVKSDIMSQLGWKTLAQLMVSGKLESKARHRHVRQKPREKSRRESVAGGVIGAMDIDGEAEGVDAIGEDSSDDTETDDVGHEAGKVEQDTAAVQEQAIHIVRNLAEDESGIDMVFEQFGRLDPVELPGTPPNAVKAEPPSASSAFPSLSASHSSHTLSSPPHPVIAILTTLLSAPPSSQLDVTLQATYAIANLANGSSNQQALILNHPPLLRAVGVVIAEFPRGFEGGDARKPAIGVVLALAKGCAGVVGSSAPTSDIGGTVITSMKCRQIMVDVGVVGTLKRICESQGGVVGVGIGHHHHHHHAGAGARGSLVHAHSFSHPHAHPHAHQHVSSATASTLATSPVTPVHLHSFSHAMDTDKEVVDLARQALDWLDHGEGYGI